MFAQFLGDEPPVGEIVYRGRLRQPYRPMPVAACMDGDPSIADISDILAAGPQMHSGELTDSTEEFPGQCRLAHENGLPVAALFYGDRGQPRTLVLREYRGILVLDVERGIQALSDANLSGCQA